MVSRTTSPEDRDMTFGLRNGVAGAIALLLVSSSLTPAARAQAPVAAQHIVVTLDKAKLIKLPEHVETIIVGSPIIADVTMLKHNGLVVVTGKGYGETNVIFLDADGQAVSEALVTVEQAQGLITVQRGLDRESYSCNPRCEPAVALGDASKFTQDASGQITARNGLNAVGGH